MSLGRLRSPTGHAGSIVGRRLAVALMAAAFVRDGSASAATDGMLQPLPGLREEVVLSGAIVKDSRLDLNRFTDPRSPAALLEEIRAFWAQRPAPVHRFSRDGWQVLVQAVGGAVETIEIRARGAGAEAAIDVLYAPIRTLITSPLMAPVEPRGSLFRYHEVDVDVVPADRLVTP